MILNISGVSFRTPFRKIAKVDKMHKGFKQIFRRNNQDPLNLRKNMVTNWYIFFTKSLEGFYTFSEGDTPWPFSKNSQTADKRDQNAGSILTNFRDNKADP